MDEFHIWNLERVNVRLNDDFLKKINEKIFLKYKTKVNAYKLIFNNEYLPFNTFKNILKESNQKKFFIPLNKILKICKVLDIRNEEIERNTLAYKTSKGVNFILNPLFPIKTNPVFDMIFAHNLGDGTIINCGGRRLPYFGYRQFDEFYRIAYIKKLEYIFGTISYKKDYFKNSTRSYCPPVLSTLFFKHYNLKINDFYSDKSRIPEKLFNKNKENLLAVLIAFVIDEGHIDSTEIVINLKNKLLIKDLQKICQILGYKSKITENSKEVNYARLHILREGMKKFWIDYINLNKKFSIINLGKKGDKINDSFKIYNRNLYKVKGNRELILKLLNCEQLSVNQLAKRLNMTRQGIRYHINKLINERKINLINNKQLNWIYGV